MKKYMNQMDMKKANAADIFALIRKSDKITRKEIEAKTGFSWGAVSTITSSLLDKNYIREFKCEPIRGAGRTPSYLEVNRDAHFVLGVDINISGFKSVLVNLKNEVVGQHFYKATYTNKKTLLDVITKFIADSLKNSDGKNIIGIGIAMQGVVDAKNGISVSVPHCKDWSDVPLAYILSKEFEIPVFIEHDPDCILYAASSAQVYKNAILLRVDEGIGMSVLMDGNIFNRLGSFEIGHTVAVPNGVTCSCGKAGCLEAYASMRGMANLAQVEFDELAAKAREGEEAAKVLFENMACHLAIAISNVAQMLCIRHIVLCGDMWNYKDIFFDSFIRNVDSMSAQRKLDFTFIDIDHAATGAALIAIENAMEHIF